MVTNEATDVEAPPCAWKWRRDAEGWYELVDAAGEVAGRYRTADMLAAYFAVTAMEYRRLLAENARMEAILGEIAGMLAGIGTPGHLLAADQCKRLNQLLAEFAPAATSGESKATAEGGRATTTRPPPPAPPNRDW